jgi:hypothetical protein
LFTGSAEDLGEALANSLRGAPVAEDGDGGEGAELEIPEEFGEEADAAGVGAGGETGEEQNDVGCGGAAEKVVCFHEVVEGGAKGVDSLFTAGLAEFRDEAVEIGDGDAGNEAFKGERFRKEAVEDGRLLPAGGHLEERYAEVAIGGRSGERKFDHVVAGHGGFNGVPGGEDSGRTGRPGDGRRAENGDGFGQVACRGGIRRGSEEVFERVERGLDRGIFAENSDSDDGRFLGEGCRFGGLEAFDGRWGGQFGFEGECRQWQAGGTGDSGDLTGFNGKAGGAPEGGGDAGREQAGSERKGRTGEARPPGQDRGGAARGERGERERLPVNRTRHGKAGQQGHDVGHREVLPAQRLGCDELLKRRNDRGRGRDRGEGESGRDSGARDGAGGGPGDEFAHGRGGGLGGGGMGVWGRLCGDDRGQGRLWRWGLDGSRGSGGRGAPFHDVLGPGFHAWSLTGVAIPAGPAAATLEVERFGDGGGFGGGSGSVLGRDLARESLLKGHGIGCAELRGCGRDGGLGGALIMADEEFEVGLAEPLVGALEKVADQSHEGRAKHDDETDENL